MTKPMIVDASAFDDEDEGVSIVDASAFDDEPPAPTQKPIYTSDVKPGHHAELAGLINSPRNLLLQKRAETGRPLSETETPASLQKQARTEQEAPGWLEKLYESVGPGTTKALELASRGPSSFFESTGKMRSPYLLGGSPREEDMPTIGDAANAATFGNLTAFGGPEARESIDQSALGRYVNPVIRKGAAGVSGVTERARQFLAPGGEEESRLASGLKAPLRAVAPLVDMASDPMLLMLGAGAIAPAATPVKLAADAMFAGDMAHKITGEGMEKLGEQIDRDGLEKALLQQGPGLATELGMTAAIGAHGAKQVRIGREHKENVAAYEAADAKAKHSEAVATKTSQLEQLDAKLKEAVDVAGETKDPVAQAAAVKLKQDRDALAGDLANTPPPEPLTQKERYWQLRREANAPPVRGERLGGGSEKDGFTTPQNRGAGMSADEVASEMKSWADGPEAKGRDVRVYDSVADPGFLDALAQDDAGQSLRSKVERSLAAGTPPEHISRAFPVPGFATPDGVTHVLAPRVESPVHLMELLDHEGTHVALREAQATGKAHPIFGRSGEERALKALAARQFDKGGPGKRVQQHYSGEEMRTIGEEVLAHGKEFIGTRLAPDAMDRAVTWVREGLRGVLPERLQGIVARATDAEIRVMLDRAGKLVAKGNGKVEKAEGLKPAPLKAEKVLDPNRKPTLDDINLKDGPTDLDDLGLILVNAADAAAYAQQKAERASAGRLPVDVDAMVAEQAANDAARARLERESQPSPGRAEDQRRAFEQEQVARAVEAKLAREREGTVDLPVRGEDVLANIAERNAVSARPQERLPEQVESIPIDQLVSDAATVDKPGKPPKPPKLTTLKKQPPEAAPPATPPTTVPPAAGVQPAAPLGKAPKTRKSVRTGLDIDSRERDVDGYTLAVEREKAAADPNYWVKYAVPDRATAPQWSSDEAARKAVSALRTIGAKSDRPLAGVDKEGVYRRDLPGGGQLRITTWQDGPRKGFPEYAWAVGPNNVTEWAYRYPRAEKGPAKTPQQRLLEKTDPKHPYRVMQGELARMGVVRDPTTDSLSKGGADVAELLAPSDRFVDQFRGWRARPTEIIGKVRFEDGDHAPLSAQEIASGLKDLRRGRFGSPEAHAINMYALDLERKSLAVDNGSIRTAEDVYGTTDKVSGQLLAGTGEPAGSRSGLGRGGVSEADRGDVAGREVLPPDGRGRGLADQAVRPGDGRVEESPFPEAETDLDRPGVKFSRRQEATPEFKEWFGKSKVTDEAGRPRVVYHGTSIPFTSGSFDMAKKASDFGDTELGFFFTADPKVADTFSGTRDEGASHVPAYLAIQRPYRLSGERFYEMIDGESALSGRRFAAMRRQLEKAGYDGIVVAPAKEIGARRGWSQFSADTYIAFRPTQIKSATGNRGTFDAANPDIRYSRRQEETPEFKEWFGDWQDPKAWSSKREPGKEPVSQAVDANGRPLVLYHGTRGDFGTHETHTKGYNSNVFGSWETERHAAFFAEKPTDAEAFTSSGGDGAGGNIRPVYLNAKAPVDFTKDGSWFEDFLAEMEAEGVNPRWIRNNGNTWELFDGEDGRRFTTAAKKLGYDSVIFEDSNPDTGEPFRAWAVFDPIQVKSATGNDGTFSRTDPDIRRSMRGASAVDADRKKLKTAQGMIRSGVDRERVRKETGWHQGTDNRWRWEGDDSEASLITEGYRKIPYVANPGKGDGIRLAEVYKNDSLYRSYPELQNIRVVNSPRPMGSTVASFDERAGIITLFPSIDGFEGGPKSAFDHETQHWVQTKEAFAHGGNAATVAGLVSPEDARKIAEDAAARVLKQGDYNRDNAAAIQEVIDGYRYHESDAGSSTFVGDVPDAIGMSEAGKRRYLAATRNGKSIADIERELADENRIIKNGEARAEQLRNATGDELRKIVEQYGDTQGFYQRLAGEEEARQTQKRAGLTADERRERDPRLDFDNPPERQIVDMGKGGIRYSRRNQDEAQLSWEAVPGMNTGRLAGIHDAPYNVRAAFTTDMDRHFKDAKGRDVIAPAFGLKDTEQISVPGYYLNSEGKEERNPSRQLFLQLPDSPDAMDKLAGYAAARGYVLRQEAVGVHVARNLREGEAENGYFVDMGSVPTEAEYKAYVEAMGAAAGGDAFKYVAVPTHSGINLWTWDDSITPAEIARVNDAASAAVRSDATMQAWPIKVDSRYIENDWSKEAPNGEGYLQQVAAAGGSPDLQARLDQLRTAADRTAEEWAKRHGWGDHQPVATAAPDAPVPRDLEKLVGRDVKSTGKTKESLYREIANVVNGKDLREMRLAAEAGRAMKGWYRESAAAIRKLFGDDTEAFVANLAALSPRQGVKENLKMATAVWEEWNKRGRPTDPDEIRAMFPRIGTVLDPETGKMREKHALVDMGGRIPNVVTALSSLGTESLSGAKVESFRKNLLGDFDAVTNDTWMAQFADISQSIFGKPAGYLAGSYMVRRVAKQLGWTPAEVQETVWTFFRELRARTDSPTHRTQEGHRPTTAMDQALAMTNADVIRGADSFAHLVRDPNVRDRLQRLGLDVDHLTEPTRLGDDATYLAVRPKDRDSRVLGRIAGRVQRASDAAWANKQLAISRIHKLVDADPVVLRDIAKTVGVPVAGRSGPQIARALQAYRDPSKYSIRGEADWDAPLTAPQVETRVNRLGIAEESLAKEKPGYEVKRLERERDRSWGGKVTPEAEKLDLVTDDDQWVRMASKKGRVLSDAEQQAINTRVETRRSESDSAMAKLDEAAALSPAELKARGIDMQALVKEEMASRLAYVAMEFASVNAGTQAARALAARRRIMSAGSDITPDAMLRRIIKELPDVDKDTAADLYKIYHSSPKEFTNALRLAMKPGKLKKAMECWKAGLLSGLGTHGANIIGNAVEPAAMLAETLVAAGIDKAMAKHFGTERTRFAGEFKHELAGQLRAVPQAFSRLVDEFKAQIIRQEEPDISAAGPLEYQVGAIGPGWGAIPFDVGKAVRTPFRALTIADRFFKAIGYEAELHKLAYREARREGFVGERADARAAAIVDAARENMGDRWREMVEKADEGMKQRVYQGEPVKIIRSLMTLTQEHPGFGFAFPFLRTPAEITRRGWQRSPMGLYGGRATGTTAEFNRQRAGLRPKGAEVGQGEVADAWARPLVGTALATAFSGLAAMGMLTGGGPTDPEEKKLKMATGWQPYSVRIPRPGTTPLYLPYGRFEPLSSLLGIVGDAFEIGDDRNVGDKIMGAIAQNYTSKQFWKGLNDFATAITSPDRSAKTVLAPIAASYAVPAVVAKAAEAIDPTFREKRSDPGLTGLPESSWRSTLRRIPGVSRGEEPIYDPLGAPAERPGNALTRFASPVQHSFGKAGKELEEYLVQIHEVPSKVPSEVSIPKSLLPPNSEFDATGTRITLTNEERAILAKSRLEAATELRRNLDKLKQMPLDDQRDLIQRVFRKAQTKAMTKLWHTSPELRERARKKVAR